MYETTLWEETSLSFVSRFLELRLELFERAGKFIVQQNLGLGVNHRWLPSLPISIRLSRRFNELDA